MNTENKPYWRSKSPDAVFPEPVDPETWWKQAHSGIDALQNARDILESPGALLCYDLSIPVLQVCSELIFRVTGEKIIPGQGVSHKILNGEYYIG